MTDSELVGLIVLTILGIMAFGVLVVVDAFHSDEDYMEDKFIKIFNKHRDRYIDSETLFYLLLTRSGYYYYDEVAETIDIKIPEDWDEDYIIDKYLSVRIFSERDFKHAYTRDVDVIWSGPIAKGYIVALYTDMLPDTEESLRDAIYARQLYERMHPEVKRNRLLHRKP